MKRSEALLTSIAGHYRLSPLSDWIDTVDWSKRAGLMPGIAGGGLKQRGARAERIRISGTMSGEVRADSEEKKSRRGCAGLRMSALDTHTP